jgi:rhodanese-related sulfurtransferase
MTTPKRAVKDALYEQLSRLGRAVSSAKRLEVLDLLSQGEKSVEALAEAADLTVGNTSAHLKVLKSARLVETRKDGHYVYYRLANPAVSAFWVAFRDLAEQQYAELRDLARQHFTDPDGLAPVDRKELAKRLKRGDVTLLDVRPADEFASAHITGAVSIPIEALRKRIGEIPKNKEVVAYCRGPYCVYALEAVSMLRKRGFRATRLEDSVNDWRVAGLPLSQPEAP